MSRPVTIVHFLTDEGKTIACREALFSSTTDLTKVTCKACLKSLTAQRRAVELGIDLEQLRRSLD